MTRRWLACGLLVVCIRCVGTSLPAEPHPWHRVVLGALLFVAALGAVALLFRNDTVGE